MVEKDAGPNSDDEDDVTAFGQEAIDFKPDPWFQPPKLKPNWKRWKAMRKTDLLVVPKSKVSVTSS